MAEDRAALVQHYRQMQEDLHAAIQGLSTELMIEPSIDGWSVKDHLGHLAQWDDIRASEVARISAGHNSAWRLTDEQEETFNALVYSRLLPLSLDQVRWELATAEQKLLATIAVATARGLDASLYGGAALRSTHAAAHTGWIRRWREAKGC